MKFWWDAGGGMSRKMAVNVEKEQVKGFGASLSDPKRKKAGNIMFSSLFSCSVPCYTRLAGLLTFFDQYENTIFRKTDQSPLLRIVIFSPFNIALYVDFPIFIMLQKCYVL